MQNQENGKRAPLKTLFCQQRRPPPKSQTSFMQINSLLLKDQWQYGAYLQISRGYQ